MKCATALLCACAPAMVAAADVWVPLMASANGDQYTVELRSLVTKGHTVEIWVQIKKASPEYLYPGSLPSPANPVYTEIKRRYVIDCQDQVFYVSYTVAYDAQGADVHTERANAPTRDPIVPGSMTAVLRDSYCKR